MSDSVFIPAPSPSQPGAKVAAGPFWPDVDLNDLRDAMRIGNSTITDKRLIPAIQGAVLTLDQDLAAWRAEREAEGNASLSACPSPEIGEESRLVVLYRRAVYAYAAADLVETHGDITATAVVVDKREANICTADDHRRNGVQAIRDIKGKRRISARLL